MKYIVLIFSLFTVSLCYGQGNGNGNNGSNNENSSKVYEACCGSKPVKFKLDNGHIYVPNVFTPNGDDVNDYFMPFIDDKMAEVMNFTVLSAEGDTIYFKRPTFVYEDIENFAWDGLKPDGTPHKGLFKYSMAVVAKKGKLRIVEGEACAIVCGEDAQVFKRKSNCFYPSQNNNGQPNDNSSNNEKDCFE